MTDPIYIEPNYANGVMRAHILSPLWTKHAFDVTRLCYQFMRICKPGDGHKPIMSKLLGRTLQVERWMDSALERLDAGVDTTLRDLAVDIFATRDVISASGESYWDKLKSPFAWAAYCWDPKFAGDCLCTNPTAMSAYIEVSEMILGANNANAELESKLRE